MYISYIPHVGGSELRKKILVYSRADKKRREEEKQGYDGKISWEANKQRLKVEN